jgi:hypothetical protein
MDIFAEAIGRIVSIRETFSFSSTARWPHPHHHSLSNCPFTHANLETPNQDHKLSIQFERLWNWTERATKVYRAKYIPVNVAEFYGSLLDINPEGKLQKEIRDIIDELNIMIAIKKKQKELICRFIQVGRQFLGEITDGHGRSSAGNGADVAAGPEPTRRDLKSFKSLSCDLQTEIENRIGDLETLLRSAQSTAEDVTDLLNLKQQQAGVVQAWQAVKQGEETVLQSRALMMFTVVTIFFVSRRARLALTPLLPAPGRGGLCSG